ncbi:MAG TPA: hypothetical protein PK152_16235 [Anaerolineales bacterium]|nr:hypothetical protein [Anaerolineae bacterium]HRJ58490.1 hypothetical protein [Anaerolineales bacterium]HRK90686.1 hypothetical protein [Anaerolineales bacterium]
MKTPAGRECPHFYGDYFRGKHVEECRLLNLFGQAWTPDLCKTCPVPDIARANSCQHMKLKASVSRPLTALFQKRVQVSAYCEKSRRDVSEPQVGCGECHALPFKFEIKE